MRLIRVGAGVVNQTALDWSGNQERLLAAIEEAREAGVQVFCLPELSITGYGCEDAFFSPDVARRAMAMLPVLAEASQGMLTAVGLPLLYQGSLYNVAALLGDGEVHGMVAKQTLAGDGIHYEPRWFKPWPSGVVRAVEVGDELINFGDLLFEVDGVRIGFEICEDAWVAQRPGASLAQRGVDIILNPSASHFAFKKQQIRERFVLEGSRAFHTTYVYTNLLGNETGRAIFDGGPMIATCGKFIASGRRFSFKPQLVIAGTVDIDLTRMARVRCVGAQCDLGDSLSEEGVVPIFMEFAPAKAEFSEAVQTRFYSKEEEFTHAMTLALFDYMRKSWSRGFVVSLSGGADSAACATLVGLMIDRLARELGPNAWPTMASYLGFEPGTPLADIKQALLFCVYQGTENSSETTRHAAETMAKALGARYSVWEIDPLVRHYRGFIEGSLERVLTWEQDDLTLQNIQARVRSPGIWMLTNTLNALLLATSNRSEAAVGYATMDGDTCGGLSPIAGIDKAFLREWLCWMEATGSEDFPPIPELSVINAQAPTAELRPLEQTQTDEADLMPYPLLDAIERSAIRDKRSPVEVRVEMGERFSQYSGEQLDVWVRRFFQLWSRNQWKRERYAPSFHLDDENLDPKTWCRFPILSGAFKAELEELG
ncbi:MAG: NAD(+) synthase [Verrucomicrobiales bacterium]